MLVLCTTIGFYMQCGEPVLGPWQGATACVRPALGRGVCGSTAPRREAIVVPDEHLFDGDG
jgi:L-methionine (R)-S-oxide reductase